MCFRDLLRRENGWSSCLRTTPTSGLLLPRIVLQPQRVKDKIMSTIPGLKGKKYRLFSDASCAEEFKRLQDVKDPDLANMMKSEFLVCLINDSYLTDFRIAVFRWHARETKKPCILLVLPEAGSGVTHEVLDILFKGNDIIHQGLAHQDPTLTAGIVVKVIRDYNSKKQCKGRGEGEDQN